MPDRRRRKRRSTRCRSPDTSKSLDWAAVSANLQWPPPTCRSRPTADDRERGNKCGRPGRRPATRNRIGATKCHPPATIVSISFRNRRPLLWLFLFNQKMNYSIHLKHKIHFIPDRVGSMRTKLSSVNGIFEKRLSL